MFYTIIPITIMYYLSRTMVIRRCYNILRSICRLRATRALPQYDDGVTRRCPPPPSCAYSDRRKPDPSKWILLAFFFLTSALSESKRSGRGALVKRRRVFLNPKISLCSRPGIYVITHLD